MKKIIISLLAIVAVTAAFATTPTILGQTGGYAVPNAYVADDVVIAASQNLNDDFDGVAFPTVSLTVPIGNAVEVSGVYASAGYVRAGRRGPVARYRVDDAVLYGFGAKVAIPVNFFSTDLALGVGYNRLDGTNEVSAYAAISKEVVNNLVVTANANYFSSESTRRGRTRTNDGFTYKFNIDAAVSDNVNLGVDFALGNTEFSVTDRYFGQSYASTANVYADVAVSDNFSIKAAMTNLSHDTDFVVGAAFSF